MSSFGERLNQYMDYMGFRQADLARILGNTPQAINQWLPGAAKLRTPMYADLISTADRLGVSLDWLTGRSVEPMWSPQIQTAQLWVQGQLDRVAGRNQSLFPMNIRMRSVLQIMSEQVPLLNEEWFSAGALGIPVEAYRRFLDGQGTVTPLMLSRLARLAGVPERWLWRGDDADRVPLANVGEYTGALAKLIARGVAPERLDQLVEMIVQADAAMK